MPDFHRVTLGNQNIGYSTSEPTPTSLPWSTVRSTFFMDVFRIGRGGRRERRQEVKVLYTKRNDRDHPLL